MEDILNEIARLEEEVRKSQAREQEYQAALESQEANNLAEQGIARERSERQGYLEAIENLRNAQTEIEGLQSKLEASAQRRAEYRRVGNTEQEAMENSEYARITEQIQNLTDKALGREVEVSKEEIENLKEEIRKSGERLKEYKDSGAEAQYANEMSERQELLNKLDELKKKREAQNEKKAQVDYSAEIAKLEEQLMQLSTIETPEETVETQEPEQEAPVEENQEEAPAEESGESVEAESEENTENSED